ncbi:MAG: hypothetical protein ACK4VW_00520 [Anaerolineales bacterium]
MNRDRFLIGILIGIGILAALTVVRVLTYSPAEMTYGEDATPQGVVHNYIVAIYRGEYEKAYSYLADKEQKPSLDAFRRSFLMGIMDNTKNMMAQVGRAEIVDGKEARVEVSIIYASSDPFSGSYSNIQYAILVRQGEAWKIEFMPYPFWDGSWYTPEIMPPPKD